MCSLFKPYFHLESREGRLHGQLVFELTLKVSVLLVIEQRSEEMELRTLVLTRWPQKAHFNPAG